MDLIIINIFKFKFIKRPINGAVLPYIINKFNFQNINIQSSDFIFY